MPLNKRSQLITQGVARSPHRAMLRAVGFGFGAFFFGAAFFVFGLLKIPLLLPKSCPKAVIVKQTSAIKIKPH